ncbi:MAG: membrane associated rhomboid family serine protease [Candidatus Thalassarchaeaceae archaeon]
MGRAGRIQMSGDFRWDILTIGDYFWVLIIFLFALLPFFYAYKDKTSVSLAMVLSLLLVRFIQYFLEIFNGDFFSFEPIHLFSLVPSFMNESIHFHRLLTSAWLHADWIHVLSNILVIALVGVPLEQRMGGKRWLVVYFLGFMGGNVAWILTHPDSNNPAIGASGAAFGLLGAYMACWPNDKIEFPLLFMIRAWPVWIIVFIRLGIEIFQVYSIQIETAGQTNVAHMAHLGGFFLAYMFARIIAKGAPSSLDDSDNIPNNNYSMLSKEDEITNRDKISNDPWKESGFPLIGNASRILNRLREEGDEIETLRAWLEELAEHVVCPVCQEAVVTEIKNQKCTLKCTVTSKHLNWP